MNECKIPIVETAAEAKEKVAEWRGAGVSPTVILRSELLSAEVCDLIRRLDVGDIPPGILGKDMPGVFDMYKEVFGIKVKCADKILGERAIGPHIDMFAAPPQALLNATEQERSIEVCRIGHWMPYRAQADGRPIERAMSHLCLDDGRPVYRETFQKGDIALMDQCLHNLGAPSDGSRICAVRLSQPMMNNDW